MLPNVPGWYIYSSEKRANPRARTEKNVTHQGPLDLSFPDRNIKKVPNGRAFLLLELNIIPVLPGTRFGLEMTFLTFFTAGYRVPAGLRSCFKAD